MELIKLENDIITAVSIGNDEETKLVKEYAIAAGILRYNNPRESKYEYRVLLDKLVEVVIIDYTALKAALHNINTYLNKKDRHITYSRNGLEDALDFYRDVPLEALELTKKHNTLYRQLEQAVYSYLVAVYGGN